MSVAGMSDFSITDITRPDPARTKRALSAAINFAKYREQCLSSFEVRSFIRYSVYDSNYTVLNLSFFFLPSTGEAH